MPISKALYDTAKNLSTTLIPKLRTVTGTDIIMPDDYNNAVNILTSYLNALNLVVPIRYTSVKQGDAVLFYHINDLKNACSLLWNYVYYNVGDPYSTDSDFLALKNVIDSIPDKSFLSPLTPNEWNAVFDFCRGFTNIVLKYPTTPPIVEVGGLPFKEAQRKVFYHLGRFWIFTSDGVNGVYRTSKDGFNWSDWVVFRNGVSWAGDFSIYVDYASNKIHVAVVVGGDVYYMRGTLNSDGSITWDTDQYVYTYATVEADAMNIFVDSSGWAWIVEAISSTIFNLDWTYAGAPPTYGSNDWGGEFDDHPLMLSVYKPNGYNPVIVRTNDVYGSVDAKLRVWYVVSFYPNPYNKMVSYDLPNSGGGIYVHHHSAVMIGNLIHISFVSYSPFLDPRNWSVYYVRFDVSTKTFSTPIKLYDDSTQVRTAIARDPNGNLYVFYNRDGTDGSKLAYKISKDGGNTWSDEIVIDSSSDTNDDDERLTVEENGYNGRISIYYEKNGKSYFTYINTTK